ncbi:MAG: hypothetical protein AMXMBFR34_09330 [Myxococcaceae bacterium]
MNDLLYRARTRVMCALLPRLGRPGRVSLGGLELKVEQGVHHPAPLWGLSVAALQELAVARLPQDSKVLELGTGAGFWALAAARAGHRVTATELPEVPLHAPRAAAAHLGLTVRFLASDLFEALAKERFDAVLFNPPFHDAEPRRPEERAWCGRSTVRRFFEALPAHLTPGGSAWVLMPRADQERYAAELSRFDRAVVDRRWFPILGTLELLRLTPADPPAPGR